MGKYLELFRGGVGDLTEKTKLENKPYVAYSTKEGRVVYTVIPKPVVYDPYVTFTAQEDNSSIGLSQLSTYQTLEYSTDTTTWNTFNKTTNIPLNNGDKVYVRGVLSADNSTRFFTRFKMSGKIAASGNCNALWNYQDLNAPLKKYCGYNMFKGCTSLTTAPELPATTLANRCYQYMFRDCTSLTTAPELRAIELARSCYYGMFKDCTSLVIAPELHAIELAQDCYRDMFSGCSSLTTAPELPATTLFESCYNCMFSGCTSLITAPVLPATELGRYCYYMMFDGCTSLATIQKILPSTTLSYSCYSYMFRNCSSLTTAPELPATTSEDFCYFHMFDGCTSLNNITCLVTGIPATQCTDYWADGVSSTGTFVKHPDMYNWYTGIHGIPEGWTVVDAEV